MGSTELWLRAGADDLDHRDVVLTWSSSVVARMESPNDEARQGHRLYDAGLRDVLWLGEVIESELIAELEMRNRVHPRHDVSRFAGLRHWVVPLPECTVEVVVEALDVRRELRLR